MFYVESELGTHDVDFRASVGKHSHAKRLTHNDNNLYVYIYIYIKTWTSRNAWSMDHENNKTKHMFKQELKHTKTHTHTQHAIKSPTVEQTQTVMF